MIITYIRPSNLEPDQVDPAAPDARLGAPTCGSTTTDTLGVSWTCTRAPHVDEDEHRAAFDLGGLGPAGTVAIAWTNPYALLEHQGDGTNHVGETRTILVAVTYADRASTGVDVEALAREIEDDARSHFWEGDQDDVVVAVADDRAALVELVELAQRGREDFKHLATFGDYSAEDEAAADARWEAAEALAAQLLATAA